MKPAWFAIPLIAIFSWLICVILIRGGGRFMDHPNERSLHKTPVPKGGGLGILSGLVVMLISLPSLPMELRWAAGLGLTLGGFSFFDDLYNLSPLVRFLVQGLLAGILLSQVGWPDTLPLPGGGSWPAVIGIVFSWLFTVLPEVWRCSDLEPWPCSAGRAGMRISPCFAQRQQQQQLDSSGSISRLHGSSWAM